jgi:hypothetical protein
MRRPVSDGSNPTNSGGSGSGDTATITYIALSTAPSPNSVTITAASVENTAALRENEGGGKLCRLPCPSNMLRELLLELGDPREIMSLRNRGVAVTESL